MTGLSGDRLGHVDAVFGGAAVRFELPRDDLGAFEDAAGAPVIAVLQRLLQGGWWVGDIALVLRCAHPDGYAGSAAPVEASLREGAPMRYLQLATRVLEAALMGVLPHEARFDEGAVDSPAG